MIEKYLRNSISKFLTKSKVIALENDVPGPEILRSKFSQINELGIYLHVPFCRQICPYCPYNKELFSPDKAELYTRAVIKEIDIYGSILGRKPVTSLYIGGGTPTTMLYNGIEKILEHIHKTFTVKCGIHMESHPNDLSPENLDHIFGLGVRNLSIGIEALQDKHLKFLKRPYSSAGAERAVNRAAEKGFACLNTDFIFALPGQTYREAEYTGRKLLRMGVDQVAAYPLFRFPYTKMGGTSDISNYRFSALLKRRKMLKVIEDVFYGSGFERTSVWAFTRQGVPKYCSVTVPLYIGLGASGGSYLKDIFYLNTFNVAEYIKSMEKGGMAVSLSLDLSEEMQMTGWLYWRIYETKFRKDDFNKRFGRDFDSVYGRIIKPLTVLRFMKDNGNQVVLSDRGTFWLHAVEDLFSIDYVSTLWGTSKQNPWPEKVNLS